MTARRIKRLVAASGERISVRRGDRGSNVELKVAKSEELITMTSALPTSEACIHKRYPHSDHNVFAHTSYIYIYICIYIYIYTYLYIYIYINVNINIQELI